MHSTTSRHKARRSGRDLGRRPLQPAQRWLAAVASIGLVSVGAVLAAPANAAVNSYFELEGNVLDASGNNLPDWGAPDANSIFEMTSDLTAVPDLRDPLPANFFDAGFSRDFITGETGDTSSFTGGGSKDIYDVSEWKCRTESNMTDKGDIQNAYAAVATEPGTGHLLLYFGMEKNAPNGNNNMGVWFLQNGSVACDGTGVGGSGKTFSGNHQDGDIFLVAAFTNGGSNPTISAYKWVGGADGSLSDAIATGGACGMSGSDNLCAITNDTDDVTTPWLTTNKGSITPQNKTGEGNLLNADQFYEGAIDLTANNLDTDSDGNPVCVNKFLFNTRSSQEKTATLYDYAAGDVNTCFEPSLATLLKQDVAPAGIDAADLSLPADGDHTVTLPVSVYDTSTLTGGVADPSGTITYSLWTDNECSVASTDPVFSPGDHTADVLVGQPSPILVFTAADEYWWQAEYTPSTGSRNEPAKSDCTSEPLIVEKQSPTIATSPWPTTLTIGGTPPATFKDTATISNGYFPEGGIAPGDVEFKLYGPFSSAPGAESCTSDKLIAPASQTVAATRSTNTTATAETAPFTPDKVGLYQWTAKYLGNAQNNATETSACGDTTEQVTVQPATPTIATKILLMDKAKVTGVNGAGAISGTVVFSLHPSLDCTEGAVYSSGSVDLDSNGEATTPVGTLVDEGSYSWKVVFTPTAGSNYTGATTTCSPAAEETAVIDYSGDSPIPSS